MAKLSAPTLFVLVAALLIAGAFAVPHSLHKLRTLQARASAEQTRSNAQSQSRSQAWEEAEIVDAAEMDIDIDAGIDADVDADAESASVEMVNAELVGEVRAGASSGAGAGAIAAARAAADVDVGVRVPQAAYNLITCNHMRTHFTSTEARKAFLLAPATADADALGYDPATRIVPVAPHADNWWAVWVPASPNGAGAPAAAVATANDGKDAGRDVLPLLKWIVRHDLPDCDVVVHRPVCDVMSTAIDTAAGGLDVWWSARLVANEKAVALGAAQFAVPAAAANHANSLWALWNAQPAALRGHLATGVAAEAARITASAEVVYDFVRTRFLKRRAINAAHAAAVAAALAANRPPPPPAPAVPLCPANVERLIALYKVDTRKPMAGGCTFGIEWELHNIALSPRVMPSHTDVVKVAVTGPQPAPFANFNYLEVRGDAIGNTGIVELVFGPMDSGLTIGGQALAQNANAHHTLRDAVMGRVQTVVHNFRAGVKAASEAVVAGGDNHNPSCTQNPHARGLPGNHQQFGFAQISDAAAQFALANGAAAWAGNYALGNYQDPTQGGTNVWYGAHALQNPFPRLHHPPIPAVANYGQWDPVRRYTVCTPADANSVAAVQFEVAPWHPTTIGPHAVANERVANQHIVDNTNVPADFYQGQNDARFRFEKANNDVQVNYLLPLASIPANAFRHAQRAMLNGPNGRSDLPAAQEAKNFYAQMLKACRHGAVKYLRNHFLNVPQYATGLTEADKGDLMGLFTVFFWHYARQLVAGMQMPDPDAAQIDPMAKNWYRHLVKTDTQQIVKALNPRLADAIAEWYRHKDLGNAQAWVAGQPQTQHNAHAPTLAVRDLLNALARGLSQCNNRNVNSFATRLTEAADLPAADRDRKYERLNRLNELVKAFDPTLHTAVDKSTPAVPAPTMRVRVGAHGEHDTSVLGVIVESRVFVNELSLAFADTVDANRNGHAQSVYRWMQPLCQQRRWDGTKNGIGNGKTETAYP